MCFVGGDRLRREGPALPHLPLQAALDRGRLPSLQRQGDKGEAAAAAPGIQKGDGKCQQNEAGEEGLAGGKVNAEKTKTSGANLYLIVGS